MKLDGCGRDEGYEGRASASAAGDALKGRVALLLGLALLGCTGSGTGGTASGGRSRSSSGGNGSVNQGDASSGGRRADGSVGQQDASANGGSAGQIEGGSFVTSDGRVITPGAGGEGAGGQSAEDGGVVDDEDSGSVVSPGDSGSSTGGNGNNVVDGGASCTTSECQPEAVRRCVCSVWGQERCCTGEWGPLCQAIADQKYHSSTCEAPPEPDGGTKGACCEAHGGLGCYEADLEECVCNLVPDCCTVAWDRFCVQLVREKHCEPGVRACVCEDWEQASCCDTLWGSVCAITAEEKCGGEPSCS